MAAENENPVHKNADERYADVPHLSLATARRRCGNEKNMEKCPEYARLRTEVENVLGNLAQVTTLLLELFRSDNSEKYKHLDKELELTVGEKERAVGLCASTSESTSADRQSGPRHVASTLRQSHCLALPSRQSSLRTTHKCVLILRPGLE